MLANFTVTTGLDTIIQNGQRVPAPGSLRAAIIAADNNNEGDIIKFAESVVSINLNGGQLEITGQQQNDTSLQILGPGPGKLSISGSGASRIFNIHDDGPLSVIIGGMTLTGGNAFGSDDAGRGGAIFNTSDLRLIEVTLENNSASQGGGGVFHDAGTLTISRSLIMGNTAGTIGGGGVLIGKAIGSSSGGGSTAAGSATIIDTTITGNSATGGSAFGGGLYNANGTMTVRQSTIVGNSASMGAGIASHGNQLPDDPMSDPPPKNVFTYIGTSIIWGNDGGDEGGDVDRVGKSTGDDPMDLMPSIFAPAKGGDPPKPGSLGYNIVGTGNAATEGPDFAFNSMTDMVGVDPGFVSDDMGNPILADYGGVTPVYMLDVGSPAIDKVPAKEAKSSHEQRGRHFARVFNYADPTDPTKAKMDIGAVERQLGTFVVDILADESDGQYSDVASGADPYTSGDFSLREAIRFSELNPELDTIKFSDGLRAPGGSKIQTNSQLSISASVIIQGPDSWFLTVAGFDPTPLVKNSDGQRVFNIDNASPTDFSDVDISNLIISGGDSAGNGGGIFNRENLTLSGMTIRNNGASLRGGGIYVQYGTLSIDGSTINDNRAGDDGGGLYVDGSATMPEVQLTSSTISANVAADRGAGITNNGGHVTIAYCTITKNNSGSTLASGIVNFQASAKTELLSTIVSGNVNNDLGFYSGATATTFVSNGYNLIGNGTPGVTARFTAPGDKPNITNPKLDPLTVTGGRVATHRPQPDSPAVDMGDPAAVAGQNGVPEFDQRGEGFARIYIDPDTMLGRIDIGSYELQPRLLTVDLAGDSDDGNYTTGNLTLREAINISNLNPQSDTIAFDITKLPPSISVADLPIMGDLTILGPGSGTLEIQSTGGSIFVIDDNDNTKLLTVTINGLQLSHATNGAVRSKENLAMDDITFVNNQSPNAGGAVNHQLGDFSLTNSLLTGNSTAGLNADGGAVYLLNTPSATLDFTTIAGNHTSQANSDGGGIALVNSSLIAQELTISGNSAPVASGRGGGLYAENSSVILTSFGVISGNSTSGSNSIGGGLAAVNSTVVFGPSSLVNLNSTNGSGAVGGGVYASGGSLSFTSSQLAQNSTTGQLASGGAMALTNGALATLQSTVVQQNYVSGLNSFGGGVANLGGSLIVRDSLVAQNEARHATAKGGGIYSDTNLLTDPALKQVTTIVNSTISGNSAPLRGGGVFNADGLTEIKHSTITNNSSGGINLGSGMASLGNSSTTMTTFYSTIVAGNLGATATSPTGTDVDFVDSPFNNTIQSLGYNLVGNGNAMGSFTAAGDLTGRTNPGLDPLADNTNDPNAAFPMLTHALQPESPAINAGSPSFNPNSYTPALTTDQRGAGFNRVRAGRIDIGAFESSFSPVIPADFNGDSRVDGFDFLTWQRNLGKPNAVLADGDANSDAAVNGADLAIWKSNFGSASVAAADSSSSAALMIADLSLEPQVAANLSSGAAVKTEAPYSVAMFGSPGNSIAERSSANEATDRDAGFMPEPAGNRVWLDAALTVHSSHLSGDDYEEVLRNLAGSEEPAQEGLEDAIFAGWGDLL
jgi:hypothetical protein